MFKNKLVIEIRRAGFVNKGAELMLHTILRKMRQRYPDSIYAVTPSDSNGHFPFNKRCELGLYQKASVGRFTPYLGFLPNLIPNKIKDTYGIVSDENVDIIIDAAGFAYSDQWGDKSCNELASYSKKWKNDGKIVILMPQAFGPYKSEDNKRAMKEVLENVNLVFAREKISYEYLNEISTSSKVLKQSCDFTNSIDGIIPPDYDSDNNKFCIVPNHRMIDKTDKNVKDSYIPFMVEVVAYALERGQKPFILVHEGNKDMILAEEIRNKVGHDINIIKEINPLKIKGILALSTGSVGSRFHGLVSALSQGVPTLATGWSHKYQMLFEDYDFPEGLLDVNISKKELHKKLDLIFDPLSHQYISEKLNKKSQNLKLQTDKMWEEVFNKLDEKIL